MADILIRGMEMPTNVFDCPLNSFGICNLAQDETHCNCIEDSRPDWCPLVPLPEGHGRLGDLDALVSKYTEEINKLEEWAKNQEKEGRLEMFRACHLRSAYLAEAKLNIEAAPTIVPAEGGRR